MNISILIIIYGLIFNAISIEYPLFMFSYGEKIYSPKLKSNNCRTLRLQNPHIYNIALSHNVSHNVSYKFNFKLMIQLTSELINKGFIFHQMYK